MTAAAALAFLKFLITFIIGWFSHSGLAALANSQAKNEAAEQKAQDPAQGNDVSDLEDI